MAHKFNIQEGDPLLQSHGFLIDLCIDADFVHLGKFDIQQGSKNKSQEKFIRTLLYISIKCYYPIECIYT